jgi:hypothetical protein
MGRWLAALRTGDNKIGNGTDVNPRNPQNPRDGGFEGFDGSLPPPSANFLSHWDAEDWQVAFDERAAILEFDEGLSRPEAARRARQEIAPRRRRKWQ